MAQKLYALFGIFFASHARLHAHRSLLSLPFAPRPGSQVSTAGGAPDSASAHRVCFGWQVFDRECASHRGLDRPERRTHSEANAGATKEVQPEWRRAFELTLASFASQHLKIVAAVRPKS